jgi:hypothetical protein
MPEVEKLAAELNALDDQIAGCISAFEARLSSYVKIAVRVPFQNGALSWAKVDGAWRVACEENGTVVPLASKNRFTRMEGVRTGLAQLLDRITPTLQENIIERRLTLQAFSEVQKRLDETLG